MPIHVIYSNDLKQLVAPLIRNAWGSGPLDVFSPVPVVVPNPATETWLRFEIARRNGVAAGLECAFIDGYLNEILERAQPDIEVLDQTSIHTVLLSIFEDVTPDGPLAEVHRYVTAGGDEADVIAKRKYQLSGQMAGLFLEYATARPELVTAWEAGKSYLADKMLFPDRTTAARHEPTERWQRALWDALRKRLDDLGKASGRRLFLLKDAWDATPLEALRPHAPAKIHLFATTLIGEVYREILGKLAAVSDVYIYAQNPCREFWEDIRFGKVFRWDAVRNLKLDDENPFHLGDENDQSPALRLWGRPGREKIRLFNALSECDFEDRFTDPHMPEAPPSFPAERRGRKGETASPVLPGEGEGRGSLLRQLQSDIMRGAATAQVHAPDESIRFLACSDIKRECEVVAEEIWKRIQANARAIERGEAEALKFSDFAVLLPNSAEQEAYLSHLTAVFDSLHGIPYSLLRRPLGHDSRIAEAVEMLLEVPFSNYERPKFLPLLAHPNVCGKIPGGDSSTWIAMAEKLNVLFEADYPGVQKNTYVGKDLYNWDQAIRRIALGTVLSGERSGRQEPYSLGGNEYLVEELPNEGTAGAGALVLLVRSLIEDARFCTSARMPLRQWTQFLTKLIDTYVCTLGDDDERTLGKILGVLHALGDADLDSRPLDYRTVIQFVRDAIGALGGARGQTLAEGVTVAPLDAVRALPFRQVFVMGLGEGRFPAADYKNPLDLRTIRRRAGDVSAREKDRYVFLETLLAARDQLTLSYVERDPGSGETVEPSTVVRELQFILTAYFEQGDSKKTQAALAQLTESHPLRRYDEKYYPPSLWGPPRGPALTKEGTVGGEKTGDHLPATIGGWREARARFIHDQVRACIGRNVPFPDKEALQSLLPDDARNKLSAWVEVAPPLAKPTATEDTFRVSISQLRDFLECPLQGASKFQLGLRDEEEDDVLAREDEVLSPGKGDTTLLLRQSFWESPTALEGAHEAYRNRYRIAELKGSMPTGVFSEATMRRDLASLATWSTNIAAFDEPFQGWQMVRFGGAESADKTLRTAPPLQLQIEVAPQYTVTVELHGTTEAVSPDGNASLTLHNNKTTGSSHELYFRGFFTCLILTAAGLRQAGQFRCLALSRMEIKNPDTYSRIVLPFTQGEARAELTAIVRALLVEDHDYFLPHKAVLEFLKTDGTGHPSDLLDRIEAARELLQTGYGGPCKYGPVTAPERFPAPPPEEAMRMIQERFGLYARCVVKPEKPPKKGKKKETK